MNQENFDLKDPWHANAHLMFGFQCQHCDAELDVDSVPGSDVNKDFLGYCVAVSKLAKESGWILLQDFSFLCPGCAKANGYANEIHST